MFDDIRFTVDSFGPDVPRNWEEICDFLNEKLDAMLQGLNPDIQEDRFEAWEISLKLWDDFFSGDIPGSPVPEMEGDNE